MRYRPFTAFGLSASAITLVLGDNALQREPERIALLRAALEAGVNSFELASADAGVAQTLADAISAVGRRAVVLSLSVGRSQSPADFSPVALKAVVDAALERTGAERFDAVILDSPGAGELPSESFELLEKLRQQGVARMIGLSGADAAIDAYMLARRFDLLAAPFNMKSGWPERNRISAAVSRGMTILGDDYAFEPAARPVAVGQPKGLARFFRRPSGPEREPTYDFMRETRGWTAAQIALAYALTEPSIASFRVRAGSPEELQGLVAVVERELPSGVAAQIEMARFSEVA